MTGFTRREWATRDPGESDLRQLYTVSCFRLKGTRDDELKAFTQKTVLAWLVLQYIYRRHLSGLELNRIHPMDTLSPLTNLMGKGRAAQYTISPFFLFAHCLPKGGGSIESQI